MADITASIAGLKMNNPVMLASGILGQTGESLLRVVREGGAGAVVTKSIGLEERSGHGNPCVLESECWILNAMGLPNPGIDDFGEEVRIALESDVPVIGSIFASTPEEFSTLAVRMEGYGTHAVELNLSCPHAERLGLEIGADPVQVKEIVKAVKDTVKAPVLAKLSPMVPDITLTAKAVKDAGGDGIVAINTIRGMKIAPWLGRPVLQNKVGGLSGPAIRPVGVRCVYEIAKVVDLPVIGVGGIMTGADALEYFMAGASAVQIGSGVHYRGITVFGDVASEIESFLDSHGHDSLKEVVGIARGC
jgi:dihydroorotate dehydrogenase (NAD+) catalytic subunit